MIGAISWDTVRRHSCSVAWAPSFDSSSARSDPERAGSQNRRRDRRTYQFDRSPTSWSMRLAAPVASYPSIASRTDRTVPCSRDSTHRSRRGRASGAGAFDRSGPSMFA